MADPADPSDPSDPADPTADAVALLAAAVDAGTLPGYALVAGRGETTEVTAHGGAAVSGEPPTPVTADTRFDLASLTKVVATLPIALRLVDTGRLRLDARVAELLPGSATAAGPDAGPDAGSITVEQLLTHTSGLPAHRLLDAGETPSGLLAEPLRHPPGTHVVYSDLGFIVLGATLEAAGGASLDRLFAEHVSGPLGLTRTGYGPVDPSSAAATEHGLRGTVHDENAAALGGSAGHAGLFGTADDLARYLRAWVGPLSADWTSPGVRNLSTTDRTPGLDGHRGLGWTARHDPYDQLGDAWPETAVFHSGFTGTSLALDPPSGAWVVLLTNDVHLGRGRGTINPLRRAVHTALAPLAR